METNQYKIIAKYIHGSEDSTDVDVHYVFDKMPSFQECKDFCDSDKSENRNIITIENGIVTNVYKGTTDEINNALLKTYSLHQQEYPLLIEHKVERNKILKVIRSVRIILSHLSRSQYRPIIKAALKSDNWNERLNVLNTIKLHEINFDSLNKHLNKLDICKVIAFQIIQCFALLVDNIEIYTKSEAASYNPDLKSFLYREEHELYTLDYYIKIFVQTLKDNIDKDEIEYYNLKNEVRK